ncbi:hypothetical protein JD844_012290 [Phrynosoma platyrhinos]|uniref:Copper transport protein ATOX1 n=1 Tax=Phrynosoma platyrhinos TaxID=52577 RepID=A0ABQ7TJK1_PHRPL|nr:hypothetical protein JD844_012290 [Phrynosoma platyrhinos]
MTCEGCSNAVTRVLNKLGVKFTVANRLESDHLPLSLSFELSTKTHSCWDNGFEKRLMKQGVQFEIDLPNKKVIIESEHSVNTLLDTLKKTGKNASYIGEK